MKSIIDVIDNIDSLEIGIMPSDDRIIDAQNKLGLSFSDEYCKYIKKYGCIIIDGREITGISDIKIYDVVSVTKYHRENNPNVRKDWYVIEQLHIDGIVIWQSATGEIYQTAPGTEPLKLCNSLAEYIQLD